MPKAALKADDLGNQLLDILSTGGSLTEMQFYGILRDIEKLGKIYQTDYLKALANAIYGRKNVAVEHFESAMSYSDEISDINFLVYLHDVGMIHKAAEVADIISRKYVSSAIYIRAFEVNLFIGKTQTAFDYLNKYIKVSEEKDADAMREKAASISSRTDNFKLVSGLNDEDFHILSSLAIGLLEKRELKPSAMNFFTVKEESVNAYIMSLETEDADLLSELNFDMAMKMAEYDNFLMKNFSFWFDGLKEKEDADHASK